MYFAVDDYTDIDYILANGYLYYIFAQHFIESGVQTQHKYSQLCKKNLENALSRLPLLLPASMEVVAALTLGARIS